jgi:hypothetical protein
MRPGTLAPAYLMKSALRPQLGHSITFVEFPKADIGSIKLKDLPRRTIPNVYYALSVSPTVNVSTKPAPRV